MLDELVQLDKEVFLFLNMLGSEQWDSFWLVATDKWSSIPVYLILLILTFRSFGPKKTLLVLITVALMITATDQLANFFKYGVQRLRPCYEEELFNNMRLVKSSCGGKFGFFSAHAANSFAVAYFFALLLRSQIKFLAALLFLWAAVVTYSRIYIGVHYPLDILTGISVGLFFSWLFAKLYIFALNKYPL